jgi:hypothetical protein
MENACAQNGSRSALVSHDRIPGVSERFCFQTPINCTRKRIQTRRYIGCIAEADNKDCNICDTNLLPLGPSRRMPLRTGVPIVIIMHYIVSIKPFNFIILIQLLSEGSALASPHPQLMIIIGMPMG